MAYVGSLGVIPPPVLDQFGVPIQPVKPSRTVDKRAPAPAPAPPAPAPAPAPAESPTTAAAPSGGAKLWIVLGLGGTAAYLAYRHFSRKGRR